ncbi:YeeE/YedE thiosulfate transporter family protein [uncultured Rhodoblastus sp.]|uniref:YeeE/YedE thiosulfate transporter family protein n=1 Tax=uncultured Rhodoblastus sp. TaxID=543037 RepID=UPI0025CDAFB2|nr:YeeE/YedE thiosulfate transporter family protein [uncultured Rhodoblastus sp.]
MTVAMSSSVEPKVATPRLNFLPYGVGAGIGVLSWIAFGVAKDPLGVTTAYSRLASLFAIPFIGADGVAANAYWKAMPLSLDYGVLFLIGLFVGSLASVLLAGSFRIEMVPSVWRERFGGSVLGRFVAAFFGGAIIMYGARLAGGCTSGHGISGGLQLAVSSWLFLGVMFATGLILSKLMFRGK